jgi:hypothetical protein
VTERLLENDEDYASVLNVARCRDEDVRFCVRCGSHVYGTTHSGSDQDFILVLRDEGARQDLCWGKNINVVLHGAGTYEKSLGEQSVFALEGLFTPKVHRLKETNAAFRYKPDPHRLYEAVQERSDADWAKAKKRMESEVHASKKRALHSLRVLAFGLQIVETGAIFDFRVAVGWWEELLTGPYETWQAIEEAFGPKRDAMFQALRRRVRG